MCQYRGVIAMGGGISVIVFCCVVLSMHIYYLLMEHDFSVLTVRAYV